MSSRTLTVRIPSRSTLPDAAISPLKSPSPRNESGTSGWEDPVARSQARTADGRKRLEADWGCNLELVADRQAIYKQIKDLERIPELNYIPSAKYVESSVEAVLHPLVKRANCMMVAGAFFGDEGKGKTVDAIAVHPKVKMVARVNSGENAGHTVFSPDGTKYAFNLCPSGLLTPGKINAIGPECVMDPVSFMLKEISQLTRDGVEYKDRLFIGDVHIVCPHHKLLDLMNSWKNPNLSTLMGMAPVHSSKAKRKGLRMDHLFNGKDAFAKQLKADLVDYEAMTKQLGITEEELFAAAEKNPKIQPHVLQFIKADDKAEYLYNLYDKYVMSNPEFPPRADVSHMLRKTLQDGGKVLLEGPQSFWLSNAAEKFWDSGTSAHTCAAGMLSASRLNVFGLRTCIINIHKTPGSSRVGSGANPVSFVPQDYFSKTDSTCVDFEAMKLDWRDVSKQFFSSINDNGILEPKTYTNDTGKYDLGVAMACATCIHKSHGEFGVTSGRPRVVGFFDCVAHAECMANQGPYCSISAFDRGDDYDEYGVCIAYVFAHPEGKSMMCNGRTFESGTIIKAGEQLPTQAILKHCQPIIKKVAGWRATPIFARGDWWQNREKPIQLPSPVCELIDIIEHFTGCRVISIGNGPKGDEIIYIKRKAQDGKGKAKPKPKAKVKAKSKAEKQKVPGTSGGEEKRIDPEDGMAYTLKDIKVYYRGQYKPWQIDEYFQAVCSPVGKNARRRR
jgi:adenylosuccinate synthase